MVRSKIHICSLVEQAQVKLLVQEFLQTISIKDSEVQSRLMVQVTMVSIK